MIAEHVGLFSIKLMCRALQVSRSGFYRWRSEPESKRREKREQLSAQIVDLYSSFKARYGAPRIAQELRSKNVSCSVNTVAKLMRERGIRALNGKGFKYPRSSLAMVNVAENKLQRRFDAKAPNQKWVTDITYIWVKDRWLYLASVMDLYSRAIVGWSLGLDMTEHLPTQALKMAFDRRDFKPGLIIHSDRGVQYRAQKYQDFIRRHECDISMSRQGNCWDNAVMESFFSRLKVELIYPEQYRCIQEAKSGIFEYIEVFYNRVRKHSAIGYVSPAEYERRCA